MCPCACGTHVGLPRCVCGLAPAPVRAVQGWCDRSGTQRQWPGRGGGRIMSQGAWAAMGLGHAGPPVCASPGRPQPRAPSPKPSHNLGTGGGANAGGRARRRPLTARCALPAIAPSGRIRFRSPARCAHSAPAWAELLVPGPWVPARGPARLPSNPAETRARLSP